MMPSKHGSNREQRAKPAITLKARQERQLISSTGSERFIDFLIQVRPATIQERLPVKLALILDRSGSMGGSKIETAKNAALAVLNQLTSRDQMSVVIFDDRIDILQRLAPITSEYKSQLRNALEGVRARNGTALYEGWLTGCNTITDSAAGSTPARCFLLTDGIANVGVTDPKSIASKAANIREQTGVSTSTFGIGTDYNELLLGPMAIAGGGQFHHLRTTDEITNAFMGELSGLLTVLTRQVRLEIKTETGVQVELSSAYWAGSTHGKAELHSVAIGDLQSEEERHVIIRFAFPQQARQKQQIVRARVLWSTGGREQSTKWQDLLFSYASDSACEDEPQNPEVMRRFHLSEADRAVHEAVELSDRGNFAGARASLESASKKIASSDDKDLQAEHQQLQALSQQMASAPLPPQMAKEIYYQRQTRSRGQSDYRSFKEPQLEPNKKRRWPWQK